MFLHALQYSQENTCAWVSFCNEGAVIWPATLLKKRLWHRCFPMNFAKFSKTVFYITLSGACFCLSMVSKYTFVGTVFTFLIQTLMTEHFHVKWALNKLLGNKRPMTFSVYYFLKLQSDLCFFCGKLVYQIQSILDKYQPQILFCRKQIKVCCVVQICLIEMWLLSLWLFQTRTVFTKSKETAYCLHH